MSEPNGDMAALELNNAYLHGDDVNEELDRDVFYRVRIFTDGASRGNPGVAGYGVVMQLWDVFEGQHRMVAKRTISQRIGPQCTNNYAEAVAVLKAVNELNKKNKAGIDVQLCSDSQVVIAWCENRKIGKNVNSDTVAILQLLFRALDEAKYNLDFKHIRRELNSEADALANRGADGTNTDNTWRDEKYATSKEEKREEKHQTEETKPEEETLPEEYTMYRCTSKTESGHRCKLYTRDSSRRCSYHPQH